MEANKSHEKGVDNSRKMQAMFDFFETARLVLIEIKEALDILSQKTIHKIKDGFKDIARKLSAMDFIFAFLSGVLMLSATLVLLSGFCVVGYQAFLWLKNGIWTEFPLLVAFNYLFEDTALQTWLNQPESWHGLHQITAWALESIPLSLTLITDGVLMILVVAVITASVALFRYIKIKPTGPQAKI